MTDGHKHRTIRLSRRGAALHLLQTPLVRTADYERVKRSRLVWGVDEPERIAGDGPVRMVQTFKLTPLGLLHTLTGLCVEVTDA